MPYKKIVLLFLLLKFCKGAIERDLLLTPYETVQMKGRTLYYNPSKYEAINGTVPWEATLKHVTFLTLFTEAASNANLSDLREYKEFMHAHYVRVHEDYPRFGDIITLAIGWVEKSLDGFAFKEGACEELCANNALAIWRVQKIRHRNPQRNFRYEMKFSVTPLNSENHLKTSYRESYYKTFILKDDLYPNSFNTNTLTRRSDSFENFSNERQARIVNYDPSKEIGYMPSLNIGEQLYKKIQKASSKVGYLSSSRNDLPTTYRPNYRVQFAKPEQYASSEETKPVVTHHFHHHYFMNDVEPSKSHDQQQIYPGSLDAIRIIQPPSAEFLSPRFVPTTTSTEPPPQAPAMLYMQQIPIYVSTFPRQAETTTPPFRQSEQQFEEIRYSEPDPLYENIDNSNNFQHTADFASKEVQHQVEHTRSEATDFASKEAQHQVEQTRSEAQSSESIEQIPSPAEDQGTHIPYFSNEPEITTIKPPPPPRPSSTFAPSSTRRTLLPKNKFFVTPPPAPTTTVSSTPFVESQKPHVAKLSKGIRKNIRSTTERPVLKWKPKRNSKAKTTVQNVTDDIEEKVLTVTPSKAEIEVLTQKSVSKSISVKVGNHSHEIPLSKDYEDDVTPISKEMDDMY